MQAVTILRRFQCDVVEFCAVRSIVALVYQIKQVVKVIWHKTASPPQTDGWIVFARWRQCALPCGHFGATWWIRLNLCFLRPTRFHNANGKSIGLAVPAQLTAESPYTVQPFSHRWPQSVPILYNGTPLSPSQNCPIPWRYSEPPI